MKIIDVTMNMEKSMTQAKLLFLAPLAVAVYFAVSFALGGLSGYLGLTEGQTLAAWCGFTFGICAASLALWRASDAEVEKP